MAKDTASLPVGRKRNKLLDAGIRLVRFRHGWPAVLVLLATMASAGYFASQSTSLIAEDYRDQFLRANLANEFVRALQSDRDEIGNISGLAFLQAGRQFAGLFPEADFYLLDSEGTIILAFNADVGRLDLSSVPLGPIREVLRNRELPNGPVYSPMPDDRTFHSVFSVAPIALSGWAGYAFVILHNRNRRLFTIAWTEYHHVLWTIGLLALALVMLFAVSWLLRSLFRNIFGRLHTALAPVATELPHFERVSAASPSYEEEMVAVIEAILSDRARLQGRENEAKQIIARVAHDVRTPLMLLQDYADRLLSGDELTAGGESKREGARLRRNVRSLTSLISDLDIFDELKESNHAVHLEPLRLQELIEELISVYSLPAGAGEVTLCSTDSIDSLPMVAADIALLERTLRNLMENAIRHTPPGGRVTVAASLADSGRVRIAVIDTGVGIPESQLQRIFEPYHQVARDNVSNGQSGLGLAIAQHAVRTLGSTLNVESLEGKGSTFWFELPVWKSDERDAAF